MALTFPAQATPIDRALEQSVIEHPKMQEGVFNMGLSFRGALLPAWGTREREKALRQLARHDYNTIFKGAIAGLIKRVQSTPWEIKSPAEDGDRWQRLVMSADFGDGDRFFSKLITDYSRHDQGSWIELIAPGDPREAPVTAITGMAVLDSIRCYPTGDPTYPVIYYDLHNKMHVLHRGRVVQFVDTPDSDESYPSIGECSLSRCVAPVMRELLIGRYIEQFLDDKPLPGIMAFGNLGKEFVTAALKEMRDGQARDVSSDWGRTVLLYGLRAEDKPSVETFSFSKPPEKFDFDTYTNLDAREIALGIGLDIQDIWELSSTGIGTGRQSEVLAQKSRGKAFGRILKGLERVINRALPEDVEFSWRYEDPQGDLEQAQLAQSAATTITMMASVLSVDEQRALLVETIPAVHDVLTDKDGKLIRRADADPKTEDQATASDVSTDQSILPQQSGEETQSVVKAFGPVGELFSRRFASYVLAALDAGVPSGTIRAGIRSELMQAGEQAYRDGLSDGGADPGNLDAKGMAAMRRRVAEWLALQTEFVVSFAAELAAGKVTEAQVGTRADLWSNKSLREIYHAGLEDASESAMYRFELGGSKEHCATCLALNGQAHPMKAYIKAGLLPGSQSLDCKGFHCQCKLVRTSGPERGRLPGVAAPSFTDRIGGWLRGLLGGGS